MKCYLDSPQKRVWAFLILFAVLVPPFLLKLITRLEPYPSIVLPSGAGKVERKGNVVQFNCERLYGFDRDNGYLRPLDEGKFLAPIPPHYLFFIYRNDFGLNPEMQVKIKSIRTLGWEFCYKNQNCLSPEKIDQTKKWLSDRLAGQGCENNKFLVRELIMSLDVTTNKLEEARVVREKTFTLF